MCCKIFVTVHLMQSSGNRLAESNLAGIATDVSALMPEEGRLAVTEAINDELLNVRGHLLTSDAECSGCFRAVTSCTDIHRSGP